MAKGVIAQVPAEGGGAMSSAGDGWCFRAERLLLVVRVGSPRLQYRWRRPMRRSGGTVRLGNRRRRLTLRRLVRWSNVRWRLVVELLGPFKKALVELASGGARQNRPSFPFIYHIPFPLV